MSDLMLLLFAVVVFAVIAITYIGVYLSKSQGERRELFQRALDKIKGFILDLIFEAEKLYGSGTGKLKKAYVINLVLNGEFYKSLPQFIQHLITFDVLSNVVDNIVETIFKNIQANNVYVQNILTGNMEDK